MNKETQRIFQITILLVLAGFLALKWVSGNLSFYINLRFSALTLLAIAGLSMMALAGIWGIMKQRGHAGDAASAAEPGGVLSTTTIVILSVPLLLGLLVPERPLSTQALDARGMTLFAPASLNASSDGIVEVAPADRTVLDWVKIFNYEPDVTAYLQQPANVTGFVYHDPRLGDGRFMVGRFAVTCCVADAFAIGMAVDWPDSAGLVENTWVNVKGPVDVITVEGRQVPLILAEKVEAVATPKEPYLFP